MKKTVPLSIIHKAVCESFFISEQDLFKKTSLSAIAGPRQWFHYFARLLTTHSLKYIGEYNSEYSQNTWSHDNVIYSDKKIKDFIEMYIDAQETKRDILYLIMQKNEPLKLTSLTYCIDYSVPVLTLN